MITVTNPRRARRKLAVTTMAGLALLLPALVGCSSDSASDEGAGKVGESYDEIVELAKEEGSVHLIAYPEDWANYGKSFEAFTDKFGVDVEVSSPDASSAEELEAVRTLDGTDKLPDVLDIGSTFTKEAVDDELVQPYKPSTWDEIPDDLKDPDGNWSSAYYGVLTIGVNTKEVDAPKTFDDLFDEQYKGKITLGGDPREGAAQLGTVWAASLANGGSLDDIEPGIEYFQKLADGGYLVNTADNTAALSTGEAAVTFDWNYNFFGAQEELENSGVDLEVVVPEGGVFGNYYAQPITAGAKHPNAARLWNEWLLSDEGAKIYAEAGAVPSRYQAIVDGGTELTGLPEADVLSQVKFPDDTQRNSATELVTNEWAEKVAKQ